MKLKNNKKSVIFALVIVAALSSSMSIMAMNQYDTMVLNQVSTVERVVVFSVDAFRFDYLQRASVGPIFKWIMEEGVTAAYSVPSNPTVTAVNHVSLITGNHVDEHGIIGNSFYDWEDNKTYSLFSDSNDPYRDTNTGLHLITSKPAVIHAEEQGAKTCVIAWPYHDSGTNYGGIVPTYLYDYDYMGAQSQRTDLGIANKAAQTIIDDPTVKMVWAWLPGVDSAGHYSGVDSITLDNVIGALENAFNKFYEKLEKNDLLKTTAVFIVSDHGMAEVTDSEYFLEDRTSFLDAVAATGVTPYIAHDAAVELLYFIGETNVTKAEVFATYLDADPTIQAVYVNADAINLNHPNRGVNISVWIEPWYSRNFGSTYVGMHGYLNTNEDMRGIFIASGPGIKQNATISGIDIRSVAPTALALIGLDSGFGAEGTILTEIFGTRADDYIYKYYTLTDEGNYAFFSLLAMLLVIPVIVRRRRK